MQNKLWYNFEVPVKSEKKDQPLALRVPQSLLDTLEMISHDEDRPLGYVARELMIRGLALYRIDGRLRDDGKPGVRSGGEVHLAPVVGSITSEKAEKERIRRDIAAVELKEPRKRKVG